MPSEPHGEGDIAVELWKKFGKIFYQRTPFLLYMTRYETDNKYGLEFKLNPWDSKQLFTVSTCDLLKE